MPICDSKCFNTIEPLPILLRLVVDIFSQHIAFDFSIPNTRLAGNRQRRMTSQSIRNQESAVWPDHRGSGRKDPVQGDSSQRGPEQNVWSSVLGRDYVSHLEEYQEYMLRGKEYLGRLV